MPAKNTSTKTVVPKKISVDLRVVLVRPLYERNVGACSRAMSNMGFEKLILISPQCELTYEAQQAAATGQNALQNKVIYNSWDEFFHKEPEGIRISTSARDGRGRLSKDLSSTLKTVAKKLPQFKKSSAAVVHLIFGPEDWGLSAEDLKYSHFCCSIPTYGENTSLNLAQAVMLSLFIVRQSLGGTRAKLDGDVANRKEIATHEIFPDKTLKTWLTEMGFDLSKPKMNVHTVMRRLLLQNMPTRKELNILEIVLQQSLRKLRLYNELTKTKKHP